MSVVGSGVGGLLSRLGGTKLINPFRRQSGFVVLDIGSSSVKVAEVQHGAAGPTITALGVAPIPPTVIQANVIQDPEPVAEAIMKLISSLGIESTQAITAVPGPAVIVKKVILPASANANIEGAVLAEAGHLIPDSLDNVNLDFQTIDWIEDGNKMEVLVVAVKKDIINSYTQTILAVGLEPVVVDVDYFALENMYELNYDAPRDGRPVALVNIGARFSSINIIKEGRSTFTGDVPVGGAEYADALTRQLGVSAADAEALKAGRSAGNLGADTAAPVLASVTDFIVEEIQRALSFFWTAATDEPLSMVLLSGGTARTSGLAETLRERLDCAVEVAEPFRRIGVGSRVDQGLIERLGPALGVTVGLATRRPGDK
jgi:type IV pilus assembly protein PilM